MSVRDVASDLLAEHDALDAIVAPLPDDAWATPTPSPGWSVADQIGHLTYFDGTAALAITDPDAFAASKDALFTSTDGGEALHARPVPNDVARRSCWRRGARTDASSPTRPPRSPTTRGWCGTDRRWAPSRS